MSLEDPFFVVKDEVLQAVTKTKALYQRWCEVQKDSNLVSKEEIEWTTNELRNSLRSIGWDVEDLEETISIVENNPKKFKLEDGEIDSRKAFVVQVQAEIQVMRDKMFENKDKKTRQGLLSSGSSQARYTRLQNEIESPLQHFVNDAQQKQQEIIHVQDEELDQIHESVGTLKTMSRKIGSELEEQSAMLDDLGYEMDNTESRMDTTMKKLAKTLHLSSDRRQWTAILALCVVMVVVVALFFIL
ncbi:syntaxin-6-like [Centruroides vittatus]|uniref:syntaxin-6-like n=1 Tax=Centruroides vittatus TaxID=120091 RepID=UPI00350EAA1B